VLTYPAELLIVGDDYGEPVIPIAAAALAPIFYQVKRSTHCEQFVNVRCAPWDRDCRARAAEQRSNRRAGSLNPVHFRLFITKGVDPRRLEDAKAIFAELCS
jgi:hypothetical protein